MESLLLEYLPILIFIAIALGLSLVMAIGSMLVARQRPDAEKLSAYECGFEAQSFSSFSTLKLPFCFLGRCRLGKLESSVFGR